MIVGEEKTVESFDGVKLFCVKNPAEQPRAVVIIVHGVCEHGGRYDYFTEKLVEFGYTVYRFDNRGHGKSGGERGYIENFQHFFDDADEIVNLAVKENPGVPVFMFGHSMGGFITAGYGMRYPDKLKGQIFCGAAVVESPAMAELKRGNFFEVKPRFMFPNNLEHLTSRDAESVKAYSEDPLVLKQLTIKLMGEFNINGAAWIAENIDKYAYPCLINHGGDDQIVSKEASVWLFDNISSIDKQIRIYPECYHEILNEKNEKEEFISEIHNWIKARI